MGNDEKMLRDLAQGAANLLVAEILRKAFLANLIDGEPLRQAARRLMQEALEEAKAMAEANWKAAASESIKP